MGKRLGKIALMIGAVLVVVVLAMIAIAELRWDRRFTAPPIDVVASRDPAVIARGRYLAYGPAHCVDCHLPPDQSQRFAANESPALAGGLLFAIPPGRFFVPNITPDSATGIGRRSDAELARLLRYGVRADGRAALPFMALQNISESDLVAVISFLRSQPPVAHAVPAQDVSLLGKFVLAFLVKPQGPDSTPLAQPPAPDTPAYGAYLADKVAECAGCHTERSIVDGSLTGPRYAGGMVTPVDSGLELVSPNLTPDSATGRIATWTEDQFVARFHAGRTIPQTIMAWEAFARMSDQDLRAIYRYLQSLPPIHNDPGPSLRRKS